jgi:hypothetical protein
MVSSLLFTLAAKIRQAGEIREWTAYEFHTAVAEYGRARSVQPRPPEAPTFGRSVPERPIGIVRGDRHAP